MNQWRVPEIQVKYAGYIERQQNEVVLRHETTGLPHDLDYGQISGLSNEVIFKVELITSKLAGEEGYLCISGITPAAISILLIHLKKNRDATKANDA